MARGGYRPNAGRKRKKEPTVPADIKAAAKASGMSPLDYMLKVMRNPEADQERRDRMAIAAAPFCHARAADGRQGKKEAEEKAAQTAGKGTEWGNDLDAPTSSSVN
jgi:hypothetical protein